MKLYICHSSSFDYQTQLYEPLKNSSLYKEHEIIFPHDAMYKDSNSLEIIKSCDIVIAEASYPSTGLGIELGRAEVFNKRIICLIKENSRESSSLHFITKEFIIYNDSSDLLTKLKKLLQQ